MRLRSMRRKMRLSDFEMLKTIRRLRRSAISEIQRDGRSVRDEDHAEGDFDEQGPSTVAWTGEV